MQKCVFRHNTDSEGPDQPVHPQSDQSHHCPRTESLDTAECMNGEAKARMTICACTG